MWMYRSLCVAALAFGGCFSSGESPSRQVDAGTTSGDAAPTSEDDAGAPSPTDDIAGMWSFELGGAASPDRVSCEATIGNGLIDVVCPAPFPVVVGQDCRRSRHELRLSAILDDGLSGSVETVDEYEGNGCSTIGFPTGLPIHEDVATMWAERTAPGVGEGFWSAVDGHWTWELLYDPSDFLRCDVTMAAGAFAILCPNGEPTTVAFECTEARASRIDGTIDADGMSAELYEEAVRDGTGCLAAGLSPYERTESIPLSATRR